MTEVPQATAREAAVEVMARAWNEAAELVRGGYDGPRPAEAALDALLAATQDEPCETCGGTGELKWGSDPNYDEADCPTCNGSGRVPGAPLVILGPQQVGRVHLWERDAMRARAEKATPGPWAQGCWGRATNVGSLQEGVGLVCPCGAGEHAHADAEFIAAARTDVPTLLDALDAAEALVSTLGEALREALLWGFRDGPRAALASYQEWEREKNPG